MDFRPTDVVDRAVRYFPALVTDIVGGQNTESFFDAGISRRISLDPEEVLIHQDEVADTVYVLVEGSLEVVRQIDADSAVLAIIDTPGSVIGEIVAMAGGTRSATVTALEETEVIELSAAQFQEHLAANPELADELVAAAVRRLEQVELTEILARHFSIADRVLVADTCDRVEWRRFNHGETLFREGDDSDSVYIVVRGRLAASARDPIDGHDVKIGEMGRGDVVGELGVLGHTPRNATVTAIRDSVVALLDESTFRGLLESRPGMMIELALRTVKQTRETRLHTAPNTVLAVAGLPRTPTSELVDLIEQELGGHGSVSRLSPERIDALLETPGIFDVERGQVGDIRVSQMVHEAELEADHLILEVGGSVGPWANRALGMADRVLMVVPPDITDAECEELNLLLGGCPVAVRRSVVLLHPPSVSSPTGAARLRESFGADDVFNLTIGSAADAARLTRVAVGRANALVLSGGGGRGFAHIGVYRALGELGFPVDIVGGTSIGAIIGLVIANGMTPDQIVAWAQQHFPKVLDYTIPLVSLIKGDRIARSARDTFGDRDIEDLWRTCFAVSTDLTTSRLHVHDRGSVVVAIRATSAIPGVMPPVPLGDSLLIDGGVLNNLPIDIARAKAPIGKVVAVDVAPPHGPGAHGDFGLSVSGWDALRSNLGSGRTQYPRISAVLMRSMITASMLERDTQVSNGLADHYLDLDMRGVSMLEFDDPSGVAARGYEAAMPELEMWLHGLR
ncbi:MAG TPA: cyclic nucleotide-binding domain-containing protein [Acidimicrobiia bacterium]|nr:cyclic nucleotide-binding domain-containing protein [Acidimicrobiia bacterium]